MLGYYRGPTDAEELNDEQETEVAKLIVLIVYIAAFFISGYLSIGEMGYFLFGKTTTAKVTKFQTILERSGGRGAPNTYSLGVEYDFTDSTGIFRHGSDRVDPDLWRFDVGQIIPVQYRAGAEGDSRVAGTAHQKAAIIFLICSAVLFVLGYRFFRDVSQAVADEKKYKEKKQPRLR